MSSPYKVNPDGTTTAYGISWPPHGATPESPAYIEEAMIKNFNGVQDSPGFLGLAGHYMALISLLMAHEKCQQPFTWNPNSELILRDYLDNQWLSIVGHGSSGKSRTIAAIAVLEFILEPEKTACLVTSTTQIEGGRRIWADVETCWNDAELFLGKGNMPGDLVSSIYTIRYRNPATGKIARNRGIALIPSNEEEAKVGLSKMVGYKAPRLRIFLDEASHISFKIVEAAETNLITGAFVNVDTGLQDFKVTATLNPNTKSDTGGRLCEPEGGWKSVDTKTEICWRSKRGFVRRFRAEDSPNVVMSRAGKCEPWEQPYPGLLSAALLESQADFLGRGSTAYQLQYDACWPDSEQVESIYSEEEIQRLGGTEKMPRRRHIATLCGLDPSFTHDGDRCPLVFEDLFEDAEGKLRLEWQKTISLDDNLDPSKSKNLQIRDKLFELDSKKLLPPWNCFGMDVTGGGGPLADFIVEKIPGASAMLRTTFNGKASDKPVSMLDRTTGREKYADLMTELWLVSKELMLSGQLGNIPDRMVKEICGRRYGGKTLTGKLKIEDKRTFKKRMGRSPDEGDALFIGCQVARERFGLIPTARQAKVAAKVKEAFDPWAPLRPAGQGSFAARARRLNGAFSRPDL